MITRKLDARQIAARSCAFAPAACLVATPRQPQALAAILWILPCVQTRKRPSADAEKHRNAALAKAAASSNATRLLCFRELQRRPKADSVSARDGGPKAGRAGKTRPCAARAKRLCGAASREATPARAVSVFCAKRYWRLLSLLGVSEARGSGKYRRNLVSPKLQNSK